jgi:uncharacterized membrane protein (DUF373 family)
MIDKLDGLAGACERFAVAALIVLLIVTILFGTGLVAWSLAEDLLHVQAISAEPKVLFDTFGLFVAVLVGVELLRILRHLLQAHEVNTTLVVQTALIALCNKVITLNLSEARWTTVIGVTGLILSLTAATYVLQGGRGRAVLRTAATRLDADSAQVNRAE